MNDFRADLHCHSLSSDGFYSSEALIELALQKGLKGLSITDHDTVAAYDTALSIAQQHEILLVSGVEFSAMHKTTSVHILAYSFAIDSPLIQDFCAKHKRRRTQRNRAILELLAAKGMPLTEEEIQTALPTPSNFKTIGRPHIALAMIKKGYTTSIQQAFQQYLGEGKPCYTPGEHFSVEETLSVIHQAKGFAIIAHPHLMINQEIMKELLQMNFDGIEGYYARFLLHQQQRWIKIGLKRGWIITGGSDFHGEEIKPLNQLGSSWVGEETFKVLYERFQQNQTS